MLKYLKHCGSGARVNTQTSFPHLYFMGGYWVPPRCQALFQTLKIESKQDSAPTLIEPGKEGR